MSDPFRDRIYVAVGAGASAYGNSIVTFDPSAGTVIAAMPVNANPDSLAISDAGTTLWVGLHDASSVIKVDVSGEEPAFIDEYPLPPTDFPPYPHHAGPMVVLPNTNSSLAISLHYDALTPSLAGVVVLDEGIPRPLRLPAYVGASRLTRGPGNFLIGFDNLTTGFALYGIRVSADGLTQTEHSNLVAGFATDIVYDTNLLFGTDGAIIRVYDPDIPQFIGRLPVTGAIFPDFARDRVWVLEGSQSPVVVTPPSLLAVDLATLREFSRTTYGTPVGAPRYFVRSYGGVFVFIADTYDEYGYTLESGIHWMRLSTD